MNLILEKDGILAYIGTRSEFGEFKAKLERRTGEASIRCWISLPAYTIQSMLGLCPHTTEAGRSEVIFYGSPLTLMLAYMFAMKDLPEALSMRLNPLKGQGYIYLTVDELADKLGIYSPRMVTQSEYQEALSYWTE